MLTTETGIARRLGRLDATEECSHREVETYHDILQHLCVDGAKRCSFGFQGRQGLLLFIERRRLVPLFPRGFAFLKEVIVQPTAFVQRAVQCRRLRFCGIEPVNEIPTHDSIM